MFLRWNDFSRGKIIASFLKWQPAARYTSRKMDIIHFEESQVTPGEKAHSQLASIIKPRIFSLSLRSMLAHRLGYLQSLPARCNILSETCSPFGTPWFHFDGSPKRLLTLKQAGLPFSCLLPTYLLPPEHSCRSMLRSTRMGWIAPTFCVHWLEKLSFENPKRDIKFFILHLKCLGNLLVATQLVKVRVSLNYSCLGSKSFSFAFTSHVRHEYFSVLISHLLCFLCLPYFPQDLGYLTHVLEISLVSWRVVL